MRSHSTPVRRLLIVAMVAALTSCVTGNPTGPETETTSRPKKTSTPKPKPSTSASTSASSSPNGNASASPSAGPSSSASIPPSASPSVAVSPSPSPSVSLPPPPPGPRTEVSVVMYAGIFASGKAEGSLTDTRFNEPGALAVDADNNVYVADTLNFRVCKVSGSALATEATYVKTLAGGTENTPFGAIKALAFDNTTKTLYVAEATRISKVNATGDVTPFAGGATSAYTDATGADAQFKAITSMVVDATGNVWIGDGARLRKATSAGVVTTPAGSDAAFADGVGTAAKFEGLSALALDPDGNLFMLDKHRVRMMTADLTVSTLAGAGTAGYQNQSGDQARFKDPMALVVDPNGDLLIADTGNHAIRWARKSDTGIYQVQTVGNLEEGGKEGGFREAASYQARFNGPSALAIRSDGVTIISDTKNFCVRKADYYVK